MLWTRIEALLVICSALLSCVPVQQALTSQFDSARRKHQHGLSGVLLPLIGSLRRHDLDRTAAKGADREYLKTLWFVAGVQDALLLSPRMLFQTDEIDGLLQSINKARYARHENVMTTLLTP